MTSSVTAAPLGRRASAYLVDAVIGSLITGSVSGVLVGASLASESGTPLWVVIGAPLVVGLAWFALYTAMQGGAGSVGMRLMGVSLVSEGSLTSLGFGRALLRNLVWVAGGLILVGYFSPLFDSSPWRRGWHDRASRALVADLTVPARPAPAEGIVGGSFSSRTIPPPSLAGVFATTTSPPVPRAAARTVAVAPTPTPTPTVEPESGATTIIAGGRGRSAGPITAVPGVTGPREQAPAPTPPASVSPPQQAAPKLTLVWDDGTRHEVTARTLFGRNPAADAAARIVSVNDDSRSLSKTHFEVDYDRATGFWVRDRHSTNGVTLRRGVEARSLTPGEPTAIAHGDSLEIGQRRISLEVAT